MLYYSGSASASIYQGILRRNVLGIRITSNFQIRQVLTLHRSGKFIERELRKHCFKCIFHVLFLIPFRHTDMEEIVLLVIIITSKDIFGMRNTFVF